MIAASIVVRLGVIEALLRFYYEAGEEPAQVVRTSFASLFWSTTAGLVILLPLAEPISQLLLGHSDAGLTRIAILGLWVFTMFEFLLALYRIDERAKAFFTLTVANVLVTIPVTVWLVVGEGDGARGLLLGQYATGAAFLALMLFLQRRRLSLLADRALLRRIMRFGLPTMPAELSLYSLNFIDRVLIVRLASLSDAGLYSLSVKFAQAINVLVKGFQLAWPPLAYSIRDDDEARRTYALIVTWFVTLTTFAVIGMWLFSRWIVDLLAAPEFFDSYKAIGLVSTGIMLYALYLVLVVVLGRTGRTEFNFPATGAGTVVNIGLNLVLIPAWGIVGAGVSLVTSYVVVLVIMIIFTQRLFWVPYEWGRLAQASLLAVALVAAGELLLPDLGAGWPGRASRSLARLSVAAAGDGISDRARASRGGEDAETERGAGGAWARRRAARRGARAKPSPPSAAARS